MEKKEDTKSILKTTLTDIRRFYLSSFFEIRLIGYLNNKYSRRVYESDIQVEML
jgi:hypothetical protein